MPLSKKSQIVSFVKNCHNVELQFFMSAYTDEAYGEWFIKGDPIEDFDPDIADSVGKYRGSARVRLSGVILTKKENLMIWHKNEAQETMLRFIDRVQEKDKKYRRWIAEETGILIEENKGISEERIFWQNIHLNKGADDKL